MDEGNKVLTTAEKHYISLRKAQRDYWRRKNPNPRPVGRPKKTTEENSKNDEVANKVI